MFIIFCIGMHSLHFLFLYLYHIFTHTRTGPISKTFYYGIGYICFVRRTKASFQRLTAVKLRHIHTHVVRMAARAGCVSVNLCMLLCIFVSFDCCKATYRWNNTSIVHRDMYFVSHFNFKPERAFKI